MSPRSEVDIGREIVSRVCTGPLDRAAAVNTSSGLRILTAMGGLIVLLVGLIVDVTAQGLPEHDFSGLAWISGDSFLVVHDAKFPEEADRVRVGIVRLPSESQPVHYRSVAVAWPDGFVPHDLESIARIPGSQDYLLVESGDDRLSNFERIFLARLSGSILTIEDTAVWPQPIQNVEGSAVATISGGHVFVFAERAHGLDSTWLSWASMELDPLSFGSFERAVFRSPDPTGLAARPVSALEIDHKGRIYVAAAHDPDVDDGPFRSVVWQVGRIQHDTGPFQIDFFPTPKRLATLDGLKVESLAVLELDSERMALIIGTDDENYGSIIRRLP